MGLFAALSFYGLLATQRVLELPIEGRDAETAFLYLHENADLDKSGDGVYATLAFEAGRLALKGVTRGVHASLDTADNRLEIAHHLFRVVDGNALALVGWRFSSKRSRITAGLAVDRDVIFPLFGANRAFELRREGDHFRLLHPKNRTTLYVVRPKDKARTLAAAGDELELPAGSIVLDAQVPLIVTIGPRNETWILLHPDFYYRFAGVEGKMRLSELGLLRRLAPTTIIGSYNMQFKRVIPKKKVDFQYRDAVQELIDTEVLRFVKGELTLATTNLDRRRQLALKRARDPVIFGGRLKRWVAQANRWLQSGEWQRVERLFQFRQDPDGHPKQLLRVSPDAVTRMREHRQRTIASRILLGTNAKPMLRGARTLITIDARLEVHVGWRDIGEPIGGVIDGLTAIGIGARGLLRIPPNPRGKRQVTFVSGVKGSLRVSASAKGLIAINGVSLAPGRSFALASGDRVQIGAQRFLVVTGDARLAISKSLDGERHYFYPQGSEFSSLVGFDDRQPGLENLWGRRPRDARELVSTIDLYLQRVVHFVTESHMRWMHSTAFRAQFPEHRFRDRRRFHRIGAVVLDARSGKLLAAVSTPSFEPTDKGYLRARDESIEMLRQGLTPSYAYDWLTPFARLTRTPELPLDELPLDLVKLRRSINRRTLNAALFDRIPPGSTMKIAVLGAYFNWMARRGYSPERALSLAPRFRCLRNLSFAGHIFRCEGHHDHGIRESAQPLVYALQKSCNIYFAKLLLYLSGVPRALLSEGANKAEMIYLKHYKVMAEKVPISQATMDAMRRRLVTNDYFAILSGLGFGRYLRDEKGRHLKDAEPEHPLLALPPGRRSLVPQGQVFAPEHLTRKRLFNGRRLEYKSLYNLALTAIGSDLDITPLQLASLLVPLANGGRTRPIAVIEGDHAPWRRLFSPSTARVIKMAMLAVVREGTAKNAFKDVPFVVYGKTGTSENVTFHRRGRERLKAMFIKKHGPGALRANSLFVGATDGCRRDVIIAVAIRNGARVLKKPDPMEAKYLAAKLFRTLARANGCGPDNGR
ncbi:MAG: hypothetical protein KC609_10795 [Myxococcales bacterium]|nr:hypothetical protein [Myxococcales bacterium]